MEKTQNTWEYSNIGKQASTDRTLHNFILLKLGSQIRTDKTGIKDVSCTWRTWNITWNNKEQKG